jgi:KipI family sensor histidine kinase inhibitor
MTRPRYLDAGDSALVVEFGSTIDPAINARVIGLAAALDRDPPAGLVETVPTYRSLLVQFDPLELDVEALIARVEALLPTLGDADVKGRRWRVPVIYGGAFGIDLEDVAMRHGLTPDEVVRRHSAAVYRVYAVGFMPGYTYLGGLDQSIATPRRMEPRLMTPAGTISIGGIQALVAGAAMPSGWHLLGRTPVRTFDAARAEPLLFQPGDEIVFHRIHEEAWGDLDARAAAGDPIAEIIGA